MLKVEATITCLAAATTYRYLLSILADLSEEKRAQVREVVDALGEADRIVIVREDEPC